MLMTHFDANNEGPTMIHNASSTQPRNEIATDGDKSYLFLIFGTFDPVGMQSNLMPEMVERVILVQDLGDRNRLYALLATFKRNLAVLVPAGTFHLAPDHPNRQNLDSFRAWLDKHGIDKRELRFAEPGSYDRIATEGVVRSSDFSTREDSDILRQFNCWRLEGRLSCISV